MFDASNKPTLPEAQTEEAMSEGVTLLIDLTQIVLAQPPVIQSLFLFVGLLGAILIGVCAVIAKPAAKVMISSLAKK